MTNVRDYDQFQLRLPPGMRDRIKAKASISGISMNEAILNSLEEAFPGQASSDAETIEQLEHCVDALMREVRRLSDETKKLKRQKQEAHATLRSTASLFYAKSKQLEGQ